MNIKVKKLDTTELTDFVALIKIFENVFEMRNLKIPPEKHLRDLLADEKFMVFVALDEDLNVVGGLTAYVLVQYYSTRPLVYIYDLAIRADLQRKGIGKKLVTSIKNYCAATGMEEVFVQADKVDDYALDFYRKNNPTAEEDVSHFYFTL